LPRLSKINKINIARRGEAWHFAWVNGKHLGVRLKSPVLFKMKIPYDSLIAIKVALQIRLEFLEEQIKKAEQDKNQNNIDFWSEKHQTLVFAIQDFQEVL
jgi:hypothetical protein